MNSILWKCTANKSFGKVAKGMVAEVVVTNRTGKPTIKEIQTTLETKYAIKIGGGMPETIFEFIKI